MENNSSFANTYKDVTVLVTGHTGFKGSWLTLWLTQLGAKVIGYSLEELPTNPSNFELSRLSEKITDIRGDIRDLDRLKSVINHYKPKIIFHLAAQPIVLKAYEDPHYTFTTNSIGTVNVLEAAKQSSSVDAIVSITTDKVYKNKSWVWGYRETDELGDEDPYSASKAMAELAIQSYRASYFANKNYGGKKIALASVRAGNVVGGGDFAEHRLVPDSAKALIAEEPIEIRIPGNTRPWQLVLEPLSGYLWLGAKLLLDPFNNYAKAWNFGPLENGIAASVVADTMIELWGSGSWKNVGGNAAKKEATLLSLDWTAAKHELGWQPLYNGRQTFSEVVDWFKEYAKQLRSGSGINMHDAGVKQILKYTEKARALGLDWTK